MRYSSVIAVLAPEIRANHSRLRHNDYFKMGNSYIKEVKRDLYSYRNLYCDKYMR